jgi:hypothetical protein
MSSDTLLTLQNEFAHVDINGMSSDNDVFKTETTGFWNHRLITK